ncbi:putative protein disulfide-isomerase [Neolecta irregularis DAH-3]|uniref:protein disulfide-isomerase n=1 Tax=Neolecta irregularis (strain DAH-3) TaxID=1198029 RepID=A0A1U7LIN1_NEOID|nr:putative protein disulfide-isomerase [Neolecta irregularis DAH-3]|eukprot:OLL22504.1 putative protein disulfide-isomerase [Neolecta irregularis DAH-3]
MKIAFILSLVASVPLTYALYQKSGPVQILDHRNFHNLLEKEPVALVEFFAPWCGHCKQLAVPYGKVAENLKGMVKIAAIDCDEEDNKPICGEHEVQGFPTIKLFKHGKVQEDYQGQRTAKAIADYAVEQIPNMVKKVTDKNLEQFLSDKNETAKVGLFTQKAATSALWKSLALNFKDKAIVFQVRDNQKSVLELFGITTFPTIFVLPGGDSPIVIYESDEIKAPALNKFVNRFITSEQTSDQETFGKSKTEVDSPKSQVNHLTSDIFESLCLAKSSKAICAIAFLPSYSDSQDEWIHTLDSTVTLAHKLNVKNFQFFWSSGSLSEKILKVLNFEAKLPAMVALNGRRGWVQKFQGDFDKDALQDFILATKNGDGKRDKIDMEKFSGWSKGDSTEPVQEAVAKEDISVTAEEPTAEKTPGQHDEL